jgi:hypothetical protein
MPSRWLARVGSPARSGSAMPMAHTNAACKANTGSQNLPACGTIRLMRGRTLNTAWFAPTILILLLVSEPSYSLQWEPSLASTGSLRTGGARLMSSDALKMGDGNIALITYWEVRTPHDLDMYRCVDTVDSAFQEKGEQCWRAQRPSGRGPVVTEGVLSSNDICGRPDNLGGVSDAAYCSFSRPFVIRTPYFGVFVEPLKDQGLVSVSDAGHELFLTSPPWPSEAFLEVRAAKRDDRSFFARAHTTRQILELADADTRCDLVTISNREWAACRTGDAPSVTTNYMIQRDTIYEVSFSRGVPAEVRARIDRVFSTLEPLPREN